MFYSLNRTFIGFPTQVEVLKIRLEAKDPYQNLAYTSFILNITNRDPLMIRMPQMFCGYVENLGGGIKRISPQT
jgi:hypothetical protein